MSAAAKIAAERHCEASTARPYGRFRATSFPDTEATRCTRKRDNAICDSVVTTALPRTCRRGLGEVENCFHRKGEVRMENTVSWIALFVAGVALLIEALAALLALLAGHARFIEVAWVSIAASLFVLALVSLQRKG